MRKQVLLLLLSTILLSFITIEIHAENDKWSENVTEITPEGNVYNVTSAAELAWVAQEVNAGSLKNKVFILQDDIDLQGKEWTPIGNGSNAFAGYFRGNNHTISNLTITQPSSSYVGLFGNSKGNSGQSTEISDLKLTNVNIKNVSSGAGALVGNAFYATVENCHVEGAISTVCGNPMSTGGLIGYAQYTVVDASSTNVAFMVTDDTSKKDYYSLGIGGIVGSAAGGMTIRNSFSAGEIKRGGDNWINNTLSKLNAGGFIGKINLTGSTNSTCVVENSFSTCSIDLTGFPTNSSTEISVGGLAGYAYCYDSNVITLSNSYYDGTITPLTTSSVQKNYVGTIAGTSGAQTTFANIFYPSGSTAIGHFISSSEKPTGLAEIPSTGLASSLNTWVQSHNAKDDYLVWSSDTDSPSLIPEALAEANTDYAWEGDICTLKTKKGLLWFVDQVNKLYNTFAGKTIKLAEGDWDMTGKEWIPIGLYGKNPPLYFSGTFDGNNQTVKFKIGEQDQKPSYQGFFGAVNNGSIKNLTVEGNVYSSGNAGILVAVINGGSISNVTSKGTLSTNSTSVAGIAGNATDCDITGCANEATVTGKQAVGGIVGAFTNGKVEGCKNSGSITGVSAVGGVIGRSEANTVIEDCVNSGNIEATQSSVAGAGGIIGLLTTSNYQCNKDAIIINSINKGKVSVPNGLCAGGIVGLAGSNGDKNNLSVVNCGNYGEISGKQYVSGLGTMQAENYKTTVENCFSVGEVTSSGSDHASLVAYAGGTVSVKNSFSNKQEGLEAIAGADEKLETENIFPTTDDNSWLDQLNQYISDYNAANPNAPQAKTWKFGEDGNPVFGLPAPVIQGETSFTSRTTVSITATTGVSIYYTTDGSTPAVNNGTLYTGSFTLTATTTVKAIAVLDGKVSDPAEQTFTYIYVPPVISTYYTVTLPSVEGVTLSRKPGNYTVEEGYSFSFGLTLDEGYGQSQPVVKANGTEVTPRQSDGKYVIRNVEEDIQVTIEGIVKNDPTANAVIEGGNRIYALRNIVYIERLTPVEVQVLTIGGRVVRSLHLASGSNQVTGLQPGVYLIRLSDGQTEKVSVR